MLGLYEYMFGQLSMWLDVYSQNLAPETAYINTPTHGGTGSPLLSSNYSVYVDTHLSLSQYAPHMQNRRFQMQMSYM